MDIHTSKAVSGKTILAILALTYVAQMGPMGMSQTFNWTGFDGDVWTRPGSWNAQPPAIPTITSIAVIDGGTGTILALREGTLSGGVNVGTLLLRNSAYGAIATGAPVATVNFGTTAALGVGTAVPSTFTLGGGTQDLRMAIGQSLRFSFDDGAFFKSMSVNGAVLGTGSVEAQLSFSPFFQYRELLLNGNAGSVQSSFSGGLTAGTRVLVSVGFDSASSGGSITQGPAGTGTLTLLTNSTLSAGLKAVDGRRTLHNVIRLVSSSGPSRLATIGGDDLTLRGAIYASDGSGGTNSIQFGGSGDFSAPSNPHSLTLGGQLHASGWEKFGRGTVLLEADNGTTLAGVGTIGGGVIIVSSNGALGSPGSSNPAYAFANGVGEGEGNIIGGQINFVENVSYASAKELRVNGNGHDSNGVVQGGSGLNMFAGHIKILNVEEKVSGTFD